MPLPKAAPGAIAQNTEVEVRFYDAARGIRRGADLQRTMSNATGLVQECGTCPPINRVISLSPWAAIDATAAPFVAHRLEHPNADA